MRILAFDCAGAQCAGAVLAGEHVVATRRITAERGHAVLLLPMLRDLVAEAGLDFRELDRYGVTTGPGSFTGIRVALAAAHGLALATGAPIIGITVFDVLAADVARAGVTTDRLLIAIESKRAECFVQMFDSRGTATTAPAMVEPDRVRAWAGPGALTVAGDAAWRLEPHLLDGDVPGGPSAAGVDPVMLARIALGATAGPPAAPFYMRPPDAAPSRTR
jgi:tRNA threonylcarbamoyladenosine biosynthesis protein TsaB